MRARQWPRNRAHRDQIVAAVVVNRDQLVGRRLRAFKRNVLRRCVFAAAVAGAKSLFLLLLPLLLLISAFGARICQCLVRG